MSPTDPPHSRNSLRRGAVFSAGGLRVLALCLTSAVLFLVLCYNLGLNYFQLDGVAQPNGLALPSKASSPVHAEGRGAQSDRAAVGASAVQTVLILPLKKGSGDSNFTGKSLQSMPAGVDGVNAHQDRGRVAKLDQSGLRRLQALEKGIKVLLPSFDGDGIPAQVGLRMEDHGWLRFGGALAGLDGSFTLNTNFDRVFGLILLPESEIAIEIVTEENGEVVMVERRLSAVICWPKAKDSQTDLEMPSAAAAESGEGVRISRGGVVPEIDTRPGAKGVVYLDFDGEQVVDTSWNNGSVINAAPSSLTPTEIREVLARVAEDYAPFDITFTTRRADYESATVGRRMRVIVTPTDSAYPGGGGVAFTGSWSRAGASFSETIPAWVFTLSAKSVAEAISHEVGHTLGLSHDGTRSTSYYSGHGGTLSSPTSWAPIMGMSYYKSLTHWSKGEYANSNNTEDDLAILGKIANGIGLADRSEAVGVLEVQGGSFSASGVLRDFSKPHSFQFSTMGGSISASVMPSAEITGYSNADLQLELQDVSNAPDGPTMAISNPLDALGASLSKVLAAGTYRLLIRSAANGEKPPGGYVLGYSAYGSVGGYRLSGHLSDTVPPPVLVGVFETLGMVGKQFSFKVQASEGSVVALDAAALPPGIRFDAAKQEMSGIPLEPGTWSLKVVASNRSGETSRLLTLIIEAASVSLSEAIAGLDNLRTTTTAPWRGVRTVRADGQEGFVAGSGLIANNSASRVQFSAAGPSVLSFYWKVSSEPRRDAVQLFVNGRPVLDATKRRLIVLSGESSWEQRKVSLPRGTSTVEFRYQKDGALSEGLDRAWVYGIKIGQPPVFSRGLESLKVPASAGSITLSGSVAGATSYAWRVNGVSLKNGASGTGTVSGADTPNLSITGIRGSNSGIYELEASNEYGSAFSRAMILVPGPPEIIEPPVAPAPLKVGQPLMLTVQASGPGPIVYEWFKDDRLIQRSARQSYQLPRALFSSAGKYVAVASNAYGRVSASEVKVIVDAAVAAPRR